MIDFHSHILPGIDDGAGSIDESIALLQMLTEQGVDHVAATPHFYAQDQPPEQFLRARAAAYKRLFVSLPSSVPEIKLGAEVLYYAGISRMEQLGKLRLEGTNLLLLEMPMTVWSGSMIKEILEMHCSRGFTVVLAHIDRYLALQNSETWDHLRQNGVLMQVNAGFFLARRTRRKAVKMLMQNEIHFLGSDCHNLKHRPPLLGEARKYIQKKTGTAFFNGFMRQNLMDWEGIR